MNKVNKVLVLGPHTDDGEFGCGATIARFIEQGKDVHYVTFSACEESVPDEFDKEVLLTEVKNAANVLGIKPENLITLRFKVRYFERDRQDILEEMVKLKKQINPDLVILPNGDDVHQDHNTIYNEGIRAFKNCSILGYELPWNNLNFKSNFHIKVSNENLQTKIKAVDCYKSQGFRKYLNEDFLVGLARTRGVQINEEFAEAFTIIRGIIR